ncbi:MAG: DsbA family protein [Pseudomonadota bacterium]
MAHQIDAYVTMRSPYSYLASSRMVEVAALPDVALTLRPVYPIAIRIPDFFEKSDPMWLSYLVRDTARVADMLGIPFARPEPDPIVQDMETSRIAEEQPYIRHLTRLAVAACDAGKGLDYYAELSRLLFGDMGPWNAGTQMKDAAARAGLDLDEMEAAIATDPGAHDAKITANEASQRAAGHWGTPLLVYDGEPFFGQDRIEMCLWRMRQKGWTG